MRKKTIKAEDRHGELKRERQYSERREGERRKEKKIQNRKRENLGGGR